MFDKNGYASGLAEAVATPTHFVILSKNRPESYLVTPLKGFEYASVLRAGLQFNGSQAGWLISSMV